MLILKIKGGQKTGKRMKTMLEDDKACKDTRKALKSVKRSEKKPWGQESQRTSKFREEKAQERLGDH